MNVDALRKHLLELLQGGHAHPDFETAIANLPVEKQGLKPPGLPHTPWRLLEHMRICQWDILEFSRNPNHISPDFPEGYWPAGDGPEREDDWDKSLTGFIRDLRDMVALVRDPKTDLFARIPWGDGQTLLREALLLADHNSYHLGQMVVVRRLLGSEPDEQRADPS